MPASIIITIALWIYPILTLLFFIFTRRKPQLRKKVLINCSIVALITMLGILKHISTTLAVIDWLLVTTIYLLVCLCVWQLWFHKHGFIHFIGILAMIAAFGLGYLSGTIGIIGVGFVTSEYETDEQQWLGNGLIYKEQIIGNAISDHRGKIVEIYKTINWLPLIEWRIQHKEYNGLITYIIPLKVVYNKEQRSLHLSAEAPFGKDSQLVHWEDAIQLDH